MIKPTVEPKIKNWFWFFLYLFLLLLGWANLVVLCLCGVRLAFRLVMFDDGAVLVVFLLSWLLSNLLGWLYRVLP